MAEFINTIDVLGDDAVVDSIIQRTITEFNDNVLTLVGANAFNGCAALKSVNMPNVKSILANAFYGCTMLESVYFPELTLADHQKTAANGAFEGCTVLKTVEMPKLMYIKNGMFKNCKALVSVDFPNAVLGTETNPGMSAFQGCTSLTSVNIPNLTVIPSYFFYDTALESSEFPLVTKVDNYGFARTKAEKYSFSSLVEIKGDFAFSECYNLTALVLRNTESVATLGYSVCFNGKGNTATPIQEGTGYI